MTETFEVGGYEYRVRPIDVDTQALLAKRILPLIGELQSLDELAINTRAMPVVFAALGKMPDADTMFILHNTLAHVDRLLPDGKFMVIWNKKAQQYQYQDIKLSDLMSITGRALEDTIGSFFPSAGPSSSGPPQA